MRTFDPQVFVVIAERLLEIGRLAYGDTASRRNLTRTQWAALHYFSRANQYSRTVSAFCSYYAVTAGTASLTIRHLVRRGFLNRHRSAVDGRSVRLDLTPKAHAALKDDPSKALAKIVQGLPGQQIAAIAPVLEALANAVARSHARRVFGSCGACVHFDARWTMASGRVQPGCQLLGVPLGPDDDTRALCAKFEGR